MATKLINYVDYDFDRLVQQLINRLKATDTWKDTYRSSTGQMMIELYAYVANLVLYYIERRAEESYLDTAQLKSSVINLVRLLNYNPKRKVSATGVLRFTLGAAHARRVIVPKYTLCKTSGGINYITEEDAIMVPGQLVADVNAVQGLLIQLNVSSSGIANQEYPISDLSIENTRFYVYVNGEQWTQVSSFTSSTNTSKNYVIRTELDETITVLFGDDVFGRSPASGDTILFTYVRSDGVNGNVYESGKVTTVGTTIYDEDSTVVNDISVSNTDAFIGGDDAEDIETIRTDAPQVFKTGERAVTKADFVAIIKNYAGVADANVWGEAEENPANYDMFNRLKIAIMMQNWEFPTTLFKQTLATYLYTKSMMTVKYEYVEPVILYVVPTMTVRIYRGYTKSQAEQNINTALSAAFQLGTTALIGDSKRLSDLISRTEVLQEVSYVHMSLELRKDLVHYYDSYYLYGGLMEVLPIIADSAKLYVGVTDATAIQIAHTNAIGVWVADSGLFTGGTIDLVTGYVGVNVSLPSGNFIWIRYQQDNVAAGFAGDVVTTKNQICKLYNDQADITEIKYTDET